MTFITDFKVDGAPLLVMDADAEISRNDLDSSESGRDESGFMHRVVLRNRVRTWSFSYSDLSEEEYRYMKALFEGKSTFVFTFKEDGVQRTAEAYCSNDSISYHNARTGRYKNFKIKVIEC